MKSISTILATVLLVIIVVAIVGLTYTFSVTLFQQATGGATNQTQQVISNLGQQLRIEAVSGNNITVRNIGPQVVNLTMIGVFLDDIQVNFIPDSSIISPLALATLTLQRNGAIGNIKIVTGASSISTQGPSVTIYPISEIETLNNNWACAKKMYVLENKKIKLFTGIPPIINSSVLNACNDLDTNRDIYVASPLKIWTKNSDSPTYRFNQSILDDTSFKNESNIASFNFSAIENISVSLSGSSAIIKYIGTIASSLEPEVKYTLNADKNYVKVEFSVTRTTSSPTAVRLRWTGDTDPPAGTWRTGEGLTKIQGAAANLETQTWIAFIPSTKNDVLGIIAGPDVEVNNTQFDSFAYIRRKTPETLNLNQKSTLIFYMISDFKGPIGNEWKPVEDAYNEILTSGG